VIARDFFKSRLNDMLGDLNVRPTVTFYPMSVVALTVFANGTDGATWRSAFLYIVRVLRLRYPRPH